MYISLMDVMSLDIYLSMIVYLCLLFYIFVAHAHVSGTLFVFALESVLTSHTYTNYTFNFIAASIYITVLYRLNIIIYHMFIHMDMYLILLFITVLFNKLYYYLHITPWSYNITLLYDIW